MTERTNRAISPGTNYGKGRVGFSGNAKLLDGKRHVAAAYSLRHINSDYAGPLARITRTSDAQSIDLYPGKNEFDLLPDPRATNIDTVEAWLGGSAATGRPYDQSGNGRDIETGAPTFSLDGLNGHPCFIFTNNAATNLKGTFSLSGSAFSFLQVSMDTVRQSGGGPDYYFGLANAGTAGIAFGAEGDAEQDYLPGDYVLFGKGLNSGEPPRFISNGGLSTVPTALEVWTGILSASRATLRRNGAALASRVALTGGVITAANQFVLGARTQTGSDGHPGWRLGEWIGFRNDINADVAAYEAACAAAWAA